MLINDLIKDWDKLEEELTKKLEKGGEFSFGNRRYRSYGDQLDVFDETVNKWVDCREYVKKKINNMYALEKNVDDLADKFSDSISEAYKNLGRIVDVVVNGHDVTCIFSDGEKQTAHCHEMDEDKWSLETGIAICIGKYFAGGTKELNDLIRKGLRAYKEHQKKEEQVKEAERVRKNKREKHRRYLERRARRVRANDYKKKLKEDEINSILGDIDELDPATIYYRLQILKKRIERDS